MGLSFRKFILFSALSFGLVGIPPFARANSISQCLKSSNSTIKSVDEQLNSFGVKPNDPCPEQDLYDSSEKKCSENVRELREIDKSLRDIMKDKCENAEEIRALTASSSCKQEECEKKSAKVYAEGAKINQREDKQLGVMREQVKEMQRFYAEIANGAKEIQEKVSQKADADGRGRDEHTDRLNKAGSARGAPTENNEQSRKFFKDAIGTVSGLVSKAKNGEISRDEIKDVKTPLTREPLAISAAAADWDKQIEARQKVVRAQAEIYTGNKGTATGNSKNLGAGTDDKTAGKTGEAASSSGGSDAAGSMGDASKAMQAASGVAGGAGGGGGSEAASSAGASPSSPYGAYEPAAAGSSGTTTANNSSNQGSTALGTHVGKSVIGPDTSGKIENLDALTKTDALPIKASSGSSTSKGASLREALRERLSQAAGGSYEGGGGSTSATTAGASSTGSNASAGAVSPDLLPMSAAVASDNPLEASSGSVGGDLGNTDFSLAGSETDAAINGMLKDFGVGGPADHGDRSLASVAQAAPEILAADSASLFLRTRETHQRSLKKGLVINGLRAKL